MDDEVWKQKKSLKNRHQKKVDKKKLNITLTKLESDNKLDCTETLRLFYVSDAQPRQNRKNSYNKFVKRNSCLKYLGEQYLNHTGKKIPVLWFQIVLPQIQILPPQKL